MTDQELQAELKKRNMVGVEIPEIDGVCHIECPLFENAYSNIACRKYFAVSSDKFGVFNQFGDKLKPGPKCPRYKGGKK